VRFIPFFLRRALQEFRLRRRFPNSVIQAGVNADRLSSLGDFSVLFANVTLMETNLGAYSYIQSGSVILNAEIGKFCSIAGGVNIGLGVHPTHMVSTSPVFYDDSQPLPKFLIHGRIFTETLPRTVIGSDVWIGQGAMIKAGIQIGVGAVIGAGAVVTKDIPPYAIAAGNPCRQIRLRFSEEITGRLIASNWWALSAETLEELAHLFSDPAELLDELERPR